MSSSIQLITLLQLVLDSGGRVQGEGRGGGGSSGGRGHRRRDGGGDRRGVRGGEGRVEVRLPQTHTFSKVSALVHLLFKSQYIEYFLRIQSIEYF
jgi:hypothetical protein